MNGATVRRWMLRAILGVAVLLFVGVLVLQSAWGKGRLRDFAVRQLASSIDGELRIESLDGPLFSSVTLRGVRVMQQGVVVLAADRVTMEYRLRSLLAGDFTFGPIDVEALRLTAFESDEGWRVKGLAVPEPTESDTPAPSVHLPDLRLTRSHISVEPLSAPARQLEGVTLGASVDVTPDAITLAVKELQARETTGGLVIARLAGALEIQGDRVSVTGLELQLANGALSGRGSFSFGATSDETEGHVASTGLLLSELTPYLTALQGTVDPGLRPSFDLNWTGPLNAVRVTGTLRSQAGDITPDVVANLVDAVAITGTAQVVGLNFAALTGDEEMASRFSGDATFDLRLAEASAFAVTGTFDARLSEALPRSRPTKRRK
jgi:hypothetical protein